LNHRHYYIYINTEISTKSNKTKFDQRVRSSENRTLDGLITYFIIVQHIKQCTQTGYIDSLF